MQIAYVAVATGNGSNPKAPPPISNLLRRYIALALAVQETVDTYQEFHDNEYYAYAILARCREMISLLSQMTAEEREIVEASHLPPNTAMELRFRIAFVTSEPNRDMLPNLAADLSNILYSPRTYNTSCSLH